MAESGMLNVQRIFKLRNLQCATINNAKIIGLADKIGSVGSGEIMLI